MRRIFVNAVDDPSLCSAYAGGVIRREGVTVAISTAGRAPALAGLMREGIEALLPERLSAWVERSEALRSRWRADHVPLADRRPRLLLALNELYGSAEAPRLHAVQPEKAPAGGFVSIPPTHPHYAWAGAQETVVQVHGVGPTDLTFVNPADDPRTKKK